jgi:HSP20 family molecular chaperone IbpA
MITTAISRKMDDMFEDFDSIFMHPFFSGLSIPERNHIIGKEDFDEKTNEFNIMLAVPGFSKDDININIIGDTLNINGEIKSNKSKRIFSEATIKQAKRIKNLDPKTVKVSLQDGILDIKYKLKKKDSPKAIEVKIE